MTRCYTTSWDLTRRSAAEPPSACVETAVLSSDDGRDVLDGLHSIAATGEYGPMHGVIGRVRLLSPRAARRNLPRGGAGDHVRAGVRRRSGLRLQATDRDCYNFLYCIQGGFSFPAGGKGSTFNRR